MGDIKYLLRESNLGCAVAGGAPGSEQSAGRKAIQNGFKKHWGNQISAYEFEPRVVQSQATTLQGVSSVTTFILQ